MGLEVVAQGEGHGGLDLAGGAVERGLKHLTQGCGGIVERFCFFMETGSEAFRFEVSGLVF